MRFTAVLPGMYSYLPFVDLEYKASEAGQPDSLRLPLSDHV